MNEPQSVAAEKIALSILAGEDSRCQPLARPADLIPLSLSDTTTWPPAVSTSLFSFQVPIGQALIWTYISLYTTLADETSPAVNYGINFSALAQIQFRGPSASANFSQLTGLVLSQAIFNKPVLFVFDSQIVPRILLTPNGSTQTQDSLRLEAEIMAYLIPSGLASAFRVHSTRVS